MFIVLLKGLLTGSVQALHSSNIRNNNNPSSTCNRIKHLNWHWLKKFVPHTCLKCYLLSATSESFHKPWGGRSFNKHQCPTKQVGYMYLAYRSQLLLRKILSELKLKTNLIDLNILFISSLKHNRKVLYM